ncbi:EamA family transporter [Ramlibacter sp.]|uniref:EamA family transporter n=1 Tax=Ramlibacter sp. TaxID=1917967 RepID=UPI003D109D3E
MPGDAIALVAAVCWAIANLTIARGARSSADSGAFLSILMTAALSGAVWLAAGGLGRLAPAAASPVGLGWFVVGGLLSLFFGRVLMYASIHWLGAVRGSSVKRLGPVFSVVLAVLVLGETLNMTIVVGMFLIFAAFAVLVAENGAAARDTAPTPARRNPGLWLGVVSAFAYAAGNIARKWGLEVLPDPTLGVFVGAVAAGMAYLASALFVASYRQAVVATFTHFNPWMIATGVLSSAGQVLFFVALDRSTVTRVTLIVSAEVFITMALSVWLGTNRERLTRPVWLAAALGFAGSIALVAFR